MSYIVHYFDEEKSSYRVGPLEEKEKFHPNGIMVDPCPGEGYKYNFLKKVWEKDFATIKDLNKGKINLFLNESYWLLVDKDSPLSTEEKTSLESLRRSFINFMQEEIPQIDLPVIPDNIKKWVSDEKVI